MKGRHRNSACAGVVRKGNDRAAAARRGGALGFARGEPLPAATPPALEAMEPRLLLAAAPTLAITEFNYKPYAASAAETAAGYNAADFEFIEIQNIGDTAVDLTGVQLNSPVMFQFAAGQSLTPGQYLVVSPFPDAFRWRYGSAIPVVGPYGGHLPNNGAEIRLVFGQDLTPIVDFTYSNNGAWPGRANGQGSTLELKNPLTTLPSQYSDPNMWRSSVAFNGTPGAGPMANPNDVVVNEVLTASAVVGRNFIELRNLTSSTLDLSGMYLSDTTADYLKFRIPDGTTVAAGGQVAFWQGHLVGDQVVVGPGEFGNSIYLDPTVTSDLYLMASDGSGHLTRFVDHESLYAAASNVSFARWPDGTGGLFPAKSPTPGAANTAGPLIGPLVISEIMIAPPGGSDMRYIEVRNPTGATVNLSNWQIAGDVSFIFPAATMLGAGNTLVVVPFDPVVATATMQTFRTTYSLPAAAQVLGPFTGTLATGGGLVQLLQALPFPGGVVGLGLDDQVNYDNKSPWPGGLNGTGKSLTRKGPDLFGDFGQNWASSLPTPGRPAAPTDIALSPTSVAEGRPIGTVVGLLTATDPDPGDRFTFSLVAGDGAQGNAAFAVVGATLRTAGPLDYETQAAYSIRLRATDLLGATFEKAFTVTVTNVAEPPVLTVPGPQTIQEDHDLVFSAAAGTAVSLADPEVAQQSVSVTIQTTHGIVNLPTVANGAIATGNGTAQVVLTGAVADVNALMDGMTLHPDQDYHGPITVTVAASDLGHNISNQPLTDSHTIAVTVSAANDAPTFQAGANQAVDEDAPAQTVVAWATGISPGPADESAQKVTFQVANDNHALFAVQPAILPNGTLSYTPAPNANGVGTVTVAAVDNGGTANGGADTSATQQFTITVRPVNDAPLAQGQSVTMPRDTELLLTLAASDVETAFGDLVFNVPALTDRGGSLVEEAHGQYRYNPPAAYYGPDTFQFTVTDNGDPAGSHANPGDLTSAAATVRIGVGNVIHFDARHPATPFRDASGDLVSLTMVGPGFGEAYLPQTGNGDIGMLLLEQTAVNSSVTIRVTATVRGVVAATTVGGVVVHGSLNQFVASTTSLQGSFLADGGVTGMNLANVSDGSVETNINSLVTNSRLQTTMKFGHLADVAVNTHGVPIASLTATDWLDGDGTADRLTAPKLGTLSVAGELGNVAIEVAGAIGVVRALRFASGSVQADSLGTLSITGRAGVPSRGIAPILGNLGASVTLLGQHLARGARVLNVATIAGELGGAMALHGNVGTIVLSTLRAGLVIDGNAIGVRVTEAMDDTPPSGDPVAWLHIGGTGIVTAARHLVRLTNGNLYPTAVQ